MRPADRAELVQCPAPGRRIQRAGERGEDLRRPPVGHPGLAGHPAQVGARRAGGARRPVTNTGPHVRPDSSQRSTWLVASPPRDAGRRARRPARAAPGAATGPGGPRPARAPRAAGAPESCSTRHNACSRRLAGSRNRASTCAAVSGAPGPAGCRVPQAAVGSALIQPWSCHQPTALRNADSSRLAVRAPAIAARAANSAASLSPVPGSSSSARGTHRRRRARGARLRVVPASRPAARPSWRARSGTPGATRR